MAQGDVRRTVHAKEASEARRLTARIVEGDDGAANELLDLVYLELGDRVRDAISSSDPAAVAPATLTRELLDEFSTDASERELEVLRSTTAVAMWHVVIDVARLDESAGVVVEPDVELGFPPERPPTLRGLDTCLDELRENSSDHAEIAALRVLGGLDVAVAADILGAPASGVARDWRFARAWMLARLSRA